ncbi:MAG: hypothetical protein K2Y16_01110 [Burkholderiales bacterium]|nr:hypothetical protein [Burkholderiales bacterium]
MRTSQLLAMTAAACLLLAGCGTAPLSRFDVTGANNILNDWSCEAADNRQACVDDYNANAGKRLLRGHLIVTVFARYGAARFDSYSEDIVNDSTKLLGRVETAENELAKAVAVAAKAGTAPGIFYEVNRVDSFLAIIDVMEIATRPTRRGLLGFVLLSSPAERVDAGLDILRNALKDKLYLDAYRKSLEKTRLYVGDDKQKLQEAWTTINTQLDESCKRLAEYAKLKAHHCIPAPTPASKPAG